MTTLAQNQLNFQEYNMSMKGPSSPVSMDVLKDNAKSEELKASAVGKVFSAETNTYVEKEQKNVFNMPVSTEPAKPSRKRKSPTENVVYEVYTQSPITDGFSSSTRVVYMGKEFYNSATEARDVADKLRAQNMECSVYSVKRNKLKHRKNIKKSATKPRPKPKPLLKCVNDFNVDFGEWQPLPNTKKSKGKQSTWWITKNIDFTTELTKEQIRNAALGLKKVKASTLVEKFEEELKTNEDDSQVNLNCILSDIGYHCDNSDKSKVRQITMRLRKINRHKIYMHKIKGMKSSDGSPTPQELLESMKMNV